MKFPSIFRSVSPMRYDVKPRYYDPVKEEIEERTSRIKRELEMQGSIDGSDTEEEDRSHARPIRGAFAQHRGIKQNNSGTYDASVMIRTLLFFVMIIGAFGYIYLGPVILNYFLYVGVITGGLYFVAKFLKRKAKDD